MRGVRGTDERPPVGRLSVAKSNRKKKNKELGKGNWMKWRKNGRKTSKILAKKSEKIDF